MNGGNLLPPVAVLILGIGGGGTEALPRRMPSMGLPGSLGDPEPSASDPTPTNA